MESDTITVFKGHLERHLNRQGTERYKMYRWAKGFTWLGQGAGFCAV